MSLFGLTGAPMIACLAIIGLLRRDSMARWLVLFLAVLVVLNSASGIFAEGLYPDNAIRLILWTIWIAIIAFNCWMIFYLFRRRMKHFFGIQRASESTLILNSSNSTMRLPAGLRVIVTWFILWAAIVVGTTLFRDLEHVAFLAMPVYLAGFKMSFDSVSEPEFTIRTMMLALLGVATVVIAAVGLRHRASWARKLALTFAALSLLNSAIWILWFGYRPIHTVFLGSIIVFNCWMISYLLRRRVKEMFVDQRRGNAEEAAATAAK